MAMESNQNGSRIIKDIQLRFETFGKGTVDLGGQSVIIDPADMKNSKRRVKEIIMQTFISEGSGKRLTHVYVKNNGSERFEYHGAIKDLLRELFVKSSGFMRPKELVVQDYLDKEKDRKIAYGEKFFKSLQKYCERHNISYSAPF